MKRFGLALLVSILMLGVMPLTTLANDEIGVTVGGTPVDFGDQGPVNVDGRVLVPARGVFEALGFTPSWNEELRQATLTSDQHTIVITIDSEVFTTDGQEHAFDVPAQIINGSTMIPLRAVLESIGLTPGWDADTNSVIVATDGTQAAGPPAEHPPQLVGVWNWGGQPYYTFNSDGTGTRGIFGDIEAFTWHARGDHLTIITDRFTEEWTMTFEGDLLVLFSRQVEMFSFIYTRFGAEVVSPANAPVPEIPEGAHSIVGMWNWEGQPYYVFYVTSRGIRGADGIYQHFRWRIENGMLQIVGAGFMEEWTYEFDGDSLTLTNELLGMTFEYVRR